MKTNCMVWLVCMAILALTLPQSAFAYVGPGAGITVIGGALAFIGAIFLVIIGFIWYPIKRLFRSKARKRTKTGTPAENPTS